MSEKQISNELMKLVKKAQVDEEQGTILTIFFRVAGTSLVIESLLKYSISEREKNSFIEFKVTITTGFPSMPSVRWFPVS